MKGPRSTSRTLYLPRLSDHALAIAAAMRSLGVAAEALPPPDRESMALGLSLCRGRECLPCFFCVGDILRKCRAPGFDPSSAAFFLPTGPGPCRFGQYRVLLRTVLAGQGVGPVEFVSPTTDDSYALFGEDARRLRRRAWQAIVAVDLLAKLLHEHRPYEVTPGECDHVYQAGLDAVVEALEAEGIGGLTRALRATARRFASVEMDRREARPRVAILGELYVMLNAESNLQLVRTVESAGGEVLLGTFADWLYFVNWRRRQQALRLRRYQDYLGALLSDLYQHRIEARLTRASRDALRHPPEAPVAEAMRLLRPCYEPDLGTEAVLTMGRALDVARHGLAGIVNVLPFSCMPGTVVAAMAPALRKAQNDIPWLDVVFDGQAETNLRTRLGAFMHQALQHHRRLAEAGRQEAS
jgi:predicted nucleotide-binding protein (sugar kinase/HSP70/actin superfamily)